MAFLCLSALFGGLERVSQLGHLHRGLARHRALCLIRALLHLQQMAHMNHELVRHITAGRGTRGPSADDRRGEHNEQQAKGKTH